MSLLTIGKLAKAGEVRVDTVRYYERTGLISPLERTEAGYRKYSNENINRLCFIRKAQGLGFTLEEIKALLELSEESKTDCAYVREYARNKITEIEMRITDLLKMKDCLENLVNFCPGEGGALSECNILKHFYGGE